MHDRFAHRAIRIGRVTALLIFVAGCAQPDADSAGDKATDAAKPVTRTARDGPVQLRVTASKDRVTVAEPLELTIEVEAPDDIIIRMPQFGSKIDEFNVRGLDEPLAETRDGERTYRRDYHLDSYASGSHAIPSVTVSYGDRTDANDHQSDADHADASPDDSGMAQVSTDPIDIEVTSLLEGEFDPAKFHDVKAVATLPRDRTWVWIYWSAGAVLAAVLLIAVIRVIRNRVKRARKVPIPLPHEWAMNQLQALAEQNLVQRGEIKTFYYRLSEIVRTYIELRFRLMAPERTTEEFLAELRSSNRLSTAHKLLLGEFLEACDRVKYALHRPGQPEIDNVFNTARDFVRQTRPAAPQTTQPHSGDEHREDGPQSREQAA